MKPATCHPSKPNAGGGLCGNCYYKARRITHPEATRRRYLTGNINRYGISIAQYEAMIESQTGLCFLCGRPPECTSKQNSRLHIDHDHATGKVRKLLCHGCNLGLGAFRDNPEVLRRAAEYVEDASTSA